MEAKKGMLKLKEEFNENINSHVFLVETDNCEACLNDIKELVKVIINSNDEITDKQIEEETYMELIIVKPDGKDIKKDQIMELQERLKLKPVLSPYLIYIINPAEALNEIASNKLLKTIEEPNPNIIGFMITKNSDILLPTIKSRCETISLMYDNDKEDCNISEEVYSLVDELVQAIENRNHEKYYSIKNNDKILKNSAKEVENLIKDYYNTACNLGADNKLNPDTINLIRKNNTYKQLIKKAKYLNLTINKLSQNMNSDLLLEKIFIELKEVN